MPGTEQWTFRLLGHFEARYGTQPLPSPTTHKATAVLACLALHAGRPLERRELIEMFWPGGHPEAGRNSLSAALSAIRRVTRDIAAQPALPLLADAHTVRLDRSCCTTDVARFEAALTAARGASGASRRARLRRALALYTGPLLPQLKYDWQPPERRALRQSYLTAAEELLEVLQQTGNWAEALELARDVARAEPLRETTQRQVLRLLARRGQFALAIEHCEQYVALLASAGAAPSPELLELASALEAGEVAPEAGRPAAVGAVRPLGLVVCIACEARARAQLAQQPGAVEVLGTGDVRGVVFAQLADALAAIRQALILAPPGLAPALALAVGDADRASEDWHERAAGRALLAAALPGQVLCDSPATALIRADHDWSVRSTRVGEFILPGESGLLPVGVVWFSDLTDWPQVELAPVARPVGALAAPDYPVVGRNQDIDALVGRLQEPDCRMVTLVGPTGCGKSRLALAVARRLIKVFAGRVWRVPLGALTAPQMIGPQLLKSLGRGWSGGDPSLELRQALDHRYPTLLVIDDVAHLLPAAAEVFAALLSGVPGLTLLVTSRLPCGLAEECLWSVEPLPLPSERQSTSEQRRNPCVALFSELARRAEPSLVLDEETLPAVVAICRHLDGLPLALELAAAAVREWGVHGIASQLAQGHNVLSLVDARRPVHQRSLRLAFDSLYELLTVEQQRAFRATGAFEGPFDALAFEAVAGAGLAAELPALVEKSLLQEVSQPNAGHYDSLKTLRAYAAAQLEAAGEAQAARRRLVDHYAAVALDEVRSRRSGSGSGAFARAQSRHANLMAAIRAAVTERLWSALATLSTCAIELDLRQDLALGEFLREPLLAAHEAAADHPGERWTALIASNLVQVSRWAGDHQTVVDVAARAMEHCQAAADGLAALYCASSGMVSALAVHRFDLAQEWFERLNTMRATTRYPGRLLLLQAQHLEAHGLWEEALVMVQEAAQQPDMLSSASAQAMLLERFATIYAELDRPHLAAEVAHHALRQVVQAAPDDPWLTVLVRLLAIAPMYAVGDRSAALHLARGAAGLLARGGEGLRGFFGVRLLEQCLIADQPELALELARQLFTGWVPEMLRPDSRHLGQRVAAELYARNHFHREAAQALRDYAAEPLDWECEPVALGEGLRIASFILAPIGQHAAAVTALRTAAAVLERWPRRRQSCLRALQAVAPEAGPLPTAEGAAAALRGAVGALAL